MYGTTHIHHSSKRYVTNVAIAVNAMLKVSFPVEHDSLTLRTLSIAYDGSSPWLLVFAPYLKIHKFEHFLVNEHKLKYLISWPH